jgi:putative pyruvate formate lyase activating enzyme
VRTAVREMHRQVGALRLDDEGLARRGLLVRHLLMPDALDDSAAIFRWLAATLGADTYVNVMDQYRPEGSVLRSPEKYAELSRPLRVDEHEAALLAAHQAGLRRIDVRRPHPRLRRLLVLG